MNKSINDWKRDFIIGFVGAVLGGLFVYLTTSLIDKSAKLTAIERSQSQVDRLTDAVVQLRVESIKTEERLIQTELLAQKKKEEIDIIARDIRERQAVINSIDIIKAIDEKTEAFSEIAQNIILDTLAKNILKWEPMSGAIEKFDITCLYAFKMSVTGIIREGYFLQQAVSPNTLQFRLSDDSGFGFSNTNLDSPSFFRTKIGQELEIDGSLFKLCFP